MINVSFSAYTPDVDEGLGFAVIAARYNGQWIFCRHRDRSTWELPGGHREPGESLEQTARRELYEETGAKAFDLSQVCVYTLSGDASGGGLLCFAEVRELGELPPTEIAETVLLDSTPDRWTYPQIQPYLFLRVNEWLCAQTGVGEVWDVYDDCRRLIGKTVRRGDPLGEGEHHLAVHIWIMAPDGRFLIMRRDRAKGFGGMWECPGGSAVAGEDSLAAALREVKEETGLTLDPRNGQVMLSLTREHDFCDVWLFRQEFSLDDIVFQPGETCGAQTASMSEVLDLLNTGEMVPFRYLDELFSRL